MNLTEAITKVTTEAIEDLRLEAMNGTQVNAINFLICVEVAISNNNLTFQTPAVKIQFINFCKRAAFDINEKAYKAIWNK